MPLLLEEDLSPSWWTGYLITKLSTELISSFFSYTHFNGTVVTPGNKIRVETWDNLRYCEQRSTSLSHTWRYGIGRVHYILEFAAWSRTMRRRLGLEYEVWMLIHIACTSSSFRRCMSFVSLVVEHRYTYRPGFIAIYTYRISLFNPLTVQPSTVSSNYEVSEIQEFEMSIKTSYFRFTKPSRIHYVETGSAKNSVQPRKVWGAKRHRCSRRTPRMEFNWSGCVVASNLSTAGKMRAGVENLQVPESFYHDRRDR